MHMTPKYLFSKYSYHPEISAPLNNKVLLLNGNIPKPLCLLVLAMKNKNNTYISNGVLVVNATVHVHVLVHAPFK